MQPYEIGKFITVPSGFVLQLDKNQYDRRKTKLKPLEEKGHYKVLEPVGFKVGESVGFQKIDKWMLNFMKLEKEEMLKISTELKKKHREVKSKEAEKKKASKNKK